MFIETRADWQTRQILDGDVEKLKTLSKYSPITKYNPFPEIVIRFSLVLEVCRRM